MGNYDKTRVSDPSFNPNVKDVRDLVLDTVHTSDLHLDIRVPYESDLPSDLGDFGKERCKLVEHAIDGIDEVEKFTWFADALYLLRQVPFHASRHCHSNRSHL